LAKELEITEKKKVLTELLCVCASQLFANSVTESNFSCVTRFLGPARLRSKGPLLAAQLLASKAKAWAQFEDPNPTSKIKQAKPVGPMSRFLRPKGVASLSFGTTSPLVPGDAMETETGGGEEEEEPCTATALVGAPAESSAATTSTTTGAAAAAATGRQSRTNRGANMQRIIRAVYGVSSGAVCHERNGEPAESDNDDEDEEYFE